MADYLMLRLDAPLISFGGPAVDNLRVIQDFPARSLLTGLLGNALGYEHGEFEQLAALQARLRYGVRCDCPGLLVRDYQTVDLGQSHLVDSGWTTWGLMEEREGASSEMTHQRYRDFLADAVFTVALALDPPDMVPTLETLADALDSPVRPLFIGRKCCLPATPILMGRIEAVDVAEALVKAPLEPWYGRPIPSGDQQAWRTDESGDEAKMWGQLVVNDERDWHNQVHVGRRIISHGRVSRMKDDEDRRN